MRRGTSKVGGKYGISHWYSPGDVLLPRWWTDGPPLRSGETYTYQEIADFYSGPFVVNVLGHTGGITTLPAEPMSGLDKHLYLAHGIPAEPKHWETWIDESTPFKENEYGK